ncbi:MAG TPA: ACT domain-containing protein [Anaerolineae bacterium]|nr:ACT domain-containing protein [Anaerolineae bacterium]
MDPNTLSPDLRRLFSGVELYTDHRPYALVSLPRDQMRPVTILFGGLADPFAALIVDKAEITVLMHELDWSLGSRGLTGMRVENDFRLITFDLVLDLDTVGFIAVVSRLLAEADLSLLPLAAYSRDHIFVRGRDFARAWKVLSDFIAECKQIKDEPPTLRSDPSPSGGAGGR